MYTENPQNTTVLLGEQAVFSCTFENIDTFPLWTTSDGETFTPSDTAGDVRYITINSTMVSLIVTATEERDGVCYVCIANLIAGPVESTPSCLRLAGEHSMSRLSSCSSDSACVVHACFIPPISQLCAKPYELSIMFL